MPELNMVRLKINDVEITMPQGATVSAAMLTAGAPCRISVSGQPRTALCGMGICFECRATVDGVVHRRTCQLACREDMRIEVDR